MLRSTYKVSLTASHKEHNTDHEEKDNLGAESVCAEHTHTLNR